MSDPTSRPTAVLVHGAFADASGWGGTIRALLAAGYTAVAPPNPLRGLASDAASVAAFAAAIEGDVVLVGHSYGGAVITQAAASVPRARALVYFAAFGIDTGESAASVGVPFPPTLLARTATPTTYPAPAAADGPDLFIARDRFQETFCADSPLDTADVMAATQRPLAAAAFTEEATSAGWRTLPSWYQVSTQDNAISPEAQRFMASRMGATTEEVHGSHTAFLVHPDRTAELITTAIRAVQDVQNV